MSSRMVLKQAWASRTAGVSDEHGRICKKPAYTTIYRGIDAVYTSQKS